jgi:hypothetical protein
MSRPRTRPIEGKSSISVTFTADVAAKLQSIAAGLRRKSWRSLVAGIADGDLVVTQVRELSALPCGEMQVSASLRTGQVWALRRICVDLGAHWRGRPSPSVLLYAIATGDLELSEPSPAASSSAER